MEKSLNHLVLLYKDTSELVIHFNNKGNRISLFYLGLVERLQAGCPGLIALLQQINSNLALEFSAGLIIRPLILDYLFGLHGYEIHQSETKAGKVKGDVEMEVELHCNKVLADSVRYTIKHVEDTYKEGWITDIELYQHYREFAKRYSPFIGPYNEDGKSPRILFDPPKQGKGIYQHVSKDPLLKHLVEYYDLYVYYSKYEHYGVFSFELLRIETEKKIKTLQGGVQLLVLHFFICLTMLNEYVPDDFVKEKLKTLGNYIHAEIFPDMPL